jgi:CHAT domain-containing protein/Tfp pilus assembly protein PilF
MLNLEEDAILKQYLLGALTQESQQQQIEQRILSDGKYFTQLQLVKDELIDEYLDDRLTGEERKRFEDYFLITEGRQKELRLARSLRRYVAEEASDKAIVHTGNKQSLRNKRASKRTSFTSKSIKAAVSLLLIIGVGFGTWRVFFYQSQLSKGLVALASAYKDKRPLEARISGFGYAPLSTTRGADPKEIDYAARDRAERILLDAIHDEPSSASHHALGKLYLAERKLVEAIDQFEKSLKLDADNAQAHSDLGAALLEQAQADLSDESSGQKLVKLSQSFEHLNRALELNDSLLEALFNRALCYQSMMLLQQARDDWQKYLEKDPNSQWAVEARQHLKSIEVRQAATARDKEQILQDFLLAYQASDDERAWQIMSRSREAITGKLIFAQLAQRYVTQSVEGNMNAARMMRQALAYAGEIELRKSGDPYISELAHFYGLSPPQQLRVLAEAHQHLQKGFELCGKSKFSEAGEFFAKAKQLFDETHNTPEAIFAEHWVSYCYYQTAQAGQSLKISERLARDCEEKSYQWLLSLSFNLLGNAEADFNEYSKAVEYTQRSLLLSEQLSDTYGTQKNLVQLANEYRSLGNHHQSLFYLQRCLDFADKFWPGQRQMWRNYVGTAMSLYASGLYVSAAEFAKEALKLGLDTTKDPSQTYLPHIYLGLIYGKLNRHEEAFRHIRLGYDIGQALQDNPVGQGIMAYAALQRAHLQRQAGAFQDAKASYDESIRLYDGLQLAIESYNAHKGRLLCFIAQGDDVSAAQELNLVLDLFEKYRAKILGERNRDIFFDAEQDTYDVAIDFQYKRLNNGQKAFEYSETSRARSLLELLHGKSQPAIKNNAPQAILSSVSQPLNLAEIQEHTPKQVQIIQYAALEERLLIWVVSKSRFSTTEVSIPLAEFETRLHSYLKLISTGSPEKETKLRHEAENLYALLIGPVEHLLERDKLICIVPDKTLNHLPFASLISPASGKYLINDYPVVYAPSSNVFALSSKYGRGKTDAKVERLLSIGNPTFDQSSYPSLAKLPTAEREAKEIAGFYKSQLLLTGINVQKEIVMSEMKRSEIIHFASHYIVDEQNPMLSKLLLAKKDSESGRETVDDALQPLDMYQMRLPRTRLVVLSACRTGGEKYYGGEGMVGMSRTFLAAGVPLVMASQWEVNSGSTSELMINFHRYRKQQGLSTVDALRRAQVDMFSSPEMRYRHPYYWASFIVIGGFSSF